MAYKKEKRGATLVVNQYGNCLSVVGNYFNKYVHHEIDLNEKKTKIVTGTHKYQYVDKPVVWRDKWLQNRFINCKQQIDNKLWFIDFNAYGYQVSFTEEVNGIDIGDDYWNIKKCQFLGKVVSRLNKYLKQEKDNAIVLHPDAEGYNDKMLMVRPDVLISCIESVNKEFPYVLKSREESYEYAVSTFKESSHVNESKLDDLPF